VQAQQQAAIAQQQAVEQAAAAQQSRRNQEKNVAYNSSVEAESHVRAAFTQVQNDLAPLQPALPETPSRFGLRSQYAAEWTKMQGTWAQEQAAALATPMTCYQKGQVTYIAGQVTYENSEVKYLDSESRNLGDSIQSSLNAASQGLDALSQWDRNTIVERKSIVSSVTSLRTSMTLRTISRVSRSKRKH
jgi:hypothetical protein